MNEVAVVADTGADASVSVAAATTLPATDSDATSAAPAPRVRGFWYYLGLSLFLSRLADQILLFIVPLIVFQTTHSVSWAGLAFFVESLPRYLAFPVCGALCDKFSPVRILHISQVYRALACVVAVASAVRAARRSPPT